MSHCYEVLILVLNVRPKKSIDKSLFKVKVTQNGFLVIVRQKTSSEVFKTDLNRLNYNLFIINNNTMIIIDYNL